jgi:predicted DNA-binding protein
VSGRKELEPESRLALLWPLLNVLSGRMNMTTAELALEIVKLSIEEFMDLYIWMDSLRVKRTFEALSKVNSNKTFQYTRDKDTKPTWEE